MEFRSDDMRRVLEIDEIHYVHYFEFSMDFSLPIQHRRNWELIYVDKGELVVVLDGNRIDATSGDLFLCRPGVKCQLQGNGCVAANVMTLGFSCSSHIMTNLSERCTRPNISQKSLLKDILRESRAAFVPPFSDPQDDTLRRAKNAPIGSEQMVEMYLIELLISVLRRNQNPKAVDKGVISVPVLDAMILYMEKNLGKRITMDRLAEEFGVSTSCIKRLFAKYKQTGAINYFTGLKIEHAKKLLRQKDCNISQIAEMLGYESSNYFCNRFKKFTGMSPMEYRNSIVAFGGHAGKII